MSKRNNNNKTFDGKQGDWEVQLLLRPDLQLVLLPEPLQGVLGSFVAADFAACLEYLGGAGRNNRGLAQGA